MTTGRYLVSINGFRCNNQTWDDASQRDGKADEVFIAVGYKFADNTGTIYDSREPIPTRVMGDTLDQNGRIQAGNASNKGGLITGDSFPTMTPWVRSRLLDDRFDWPPYKVWEGNLKQGDDAIFITPTIWEWDLGTSFWNTLLAWHVAIDAKFGMRAKEIFGGIWPVSRPIFDVVSLVIQTAGTLPGIWGPLGSSGTRPIGVQRDPSKPADNDAIIFNLQTLILTYETAEYLITNDPMGRGNGIFAIRYADDPFLAGDYTLYLQVEKLPTPVPPQNFYPDLSLLRENSHPEVYVIVGNAPFLVPDVSTLSRLYGHPSLVQVVPDGTIATLLQFPKEGTILKEDSQPDIWYIAYDEIEQVLKKRRFISEVALDQYGGWSQVRVVPDNALVIYPVWEEIHPSVISLPDTWTRFRGSTPIGPIR